jgi:hypothetical protein
MTAPTSSLRGQQEPASLVTVALGLRDRGEEQR